MIEALSVTASGDEMAISTLPIGCGRPRRFGLSYSVVTPKVKKVGSNMHGQTPIFPCATGLFDSACFESAGGLCPCKMRKII